MIRRAIVPSLALLLPLTALPSCASSGVSQGPAKVDDLVGWIERVYVEAELAKERAQTAVAQLEAILASNFEGDPVSAYTQFVESVRRSEAQAKRLAKQVEPMKAAAEPVFDQWQTNLESFENERMKQRSAIRLANTRQRYEQILAAVVPAQEEYAKLNAALRDHALFLGNDFNPEAVAEIQDEAKALITMAGELDRKFDACMNSTRSYVESSALPVHVTPAPAPGGSASRFRRRR